MQIIIPDSAVKYILMQRTTYQRFVYIKGLYRLSRLLPEKLFHRSLVAIEAKARKDSIKYLYNQDMLNEYNSIKNWLPSLADTILDIGCGVAGIDVLLNWHFQQQSASIHFYLLDKTATNKSIFYGFEQRGAFYNSLTVAREVLTQNGLAQERISLLEATPDYQINISESVDFIISLISWGFHYPVATYLPQAYKILKPGGRLILDIRKNSGEYIIFGELFSLLTVISETEKSLRIVAVK